MATWAIVSTDPSPRMARNPATKAWSQRSAFVHFQAILTNNVKLKPLVVREVCLDKLHRGSADTGESWQGFATLAAKVLTQFRREQSKNITQRQHHDRDYRNPWLVHEHRRSRKFSSLPEWKIRCLQIDGYTYRCKIPDSLQLYPLCCSQGAERRSSGPEYIITN